MAGARDQQPGGASSTTGSLPFEAGGHKPNVGIHNITPEAASEITPLAEVRAIAARCGYSEIKYSAAHHAIVFFRRPVSSGSGAGHQQQYHPPLDPTNPLSRNAANTSFAEEGGATFPRASPATASPRVMTESNLANVHGNVSRTNSVMDPAHQFPVTVECFMLTGDVAVSVPHPRQPTSKIFHFDALLSAASFAAVLQRPWDEGLFSYRFSSFVASLREDCGTPIPPPVSESTSLQRQIGIVDRELNELQLERDELVRRLEIVAALTANNPNQQMNNGFQALSGSHLQDQPAAGSSQFQSQHYALGVTSPYWIGNNNSNNQQQQQPGPIQRQVSNSTLYNAVSNKSPLVTSNSSLARQQEAEKQNEQLRRDMEALKQQMANLAISAGAGKISMARAVQFDNGSNHVTSVSSVEGTQNASSPYANSAYGSSPSHPAQSSTPPSPGAPIQQRGVSGRKLSASSTSSMRPRGQLDIGRPALPPGAQHQGNAGCLSPGRTTSPVNGAKSPNTSEAAGALPGGRPPAPIHYRSGSSPTPGQPQSSAGAMYPAGGGGGGGGERGSGQSYPDADEGHLAATTSNMDFVSGDDGEAQIVSAPIPAGMSGGDSADRMKGNRCVYSFGFADYHNEFSRHWRQAPSEIHSVAMGRGFFIIYECGAISWYDICPLLESKLKAQGVVNCAAKDSSANAPQLPNVGVPRLKYVVLGPEASFYIKFEDGKMEWCGADSLGDTLRFGVNQKRLLVEKVAFGSNGSWFVLWSDGSFDYENLPHSLEDRLKQRMNMIKDNDQTLSAGGEGGWANQGMKPHGGQITTKEQQQAVGLKDITIGSHGEWFIIYKDHSVQADNLPDPLYTALSNIREAGGRVRCIVFGENRTWFTRFWDGGGSYSNNSTQQIAAPSSSIESAGASGATHHTPVSPCPPTPNVYW